ncbi:serum amyloid P-component [Talpa occidentalis]|uniref:serum amyloid P-component-like n=1 Tax=Talpa occidentalis TaxID=50954 RepID=UPI00188F0BD9|nr:serum amyloid P-component-like [Talpa occidentalis]XP_037363929.1 serum amyloid P-component [Talpa occidentalis]
MDKLLLWVSVLTTLSGVLAQTDLNRKVFVFPRESSSDHVSLKAELEKPLQNFTLCLRAFSDLVHGYSLFSYNVRGKDNELLVFKEKIGLYSLHIGGTKVTFKVTEEFPAPVHLCVIWESSTGIAEFWINSKPLVKKGLKQGYSLGTHPKIILGQEQDSYGGGFDENQSFVGEIGDVCMWDSLLSPDNIKSLYHSSTCLSPNFLNWKALNYETKGYVVTKPRVWN